MSIETTLADARSLISNGQTPAALALLENARFRYQNHAGIALLLADTLQVSGRLTDAIAVYEIALRIGDRSPDGWFGAGCAHLALGASAAAAACFSRALALAPRSGPVLYSLAKSLFEIGRIDDAIRLFERAERADPEVAEMARASIACIIPGSPKADHVAILEARCRWADKSARRVAAQQRRTDPMQGRKLKIGYLSAFFGASNWMKPVMPLLNQHDREAFEIYMLSDGQPPSADSGYRDHADDYIYDLQGVTNERVAEIIADTGIDVLVDLNGYSYQKRLTVLMHRPAPHIVGWFNMFATTGVAAVDWLVGDHQVIRDSEIQYYTERIHRLPGTYLAFDVLYDVPDVATARDDDGITFGCLGSHYKLTDPVLSAWARILRGAPSAKLFIKNAALEDNSVRDDLTNRLSALGIEKQRVTLDGPSPHFEFLRAYRHIDIALDTFPYNGGTTTTEAIWQGVPVLAFDGDRWASRTSQSLLTAAGLQDWVLPDLDAYVDRAIALANGPGTPSMLALLRGQMRDRLRASAACDTDGLCRAMEDFYRTITR